MHETLLSSGVSKGVSGEEGIQARSGLVGRLSFPLCCQQLGPWFWSA